MPDTQLPKPPCTLAEIAACLPEATLVGDGSFTVKELVHPRMTRSADDLALILEAAALGLMHDGLRARAAIISEDIAVPEGMFDGYIQVKRPRFALVALLQIFEKPLHAYDGVHPTAIVEPSASLHPSVKVGAFSYVGENAVLGKDTVLMSHVTVGAEAMLGEHCLVHAGARIGERVIIGNKVILHHNCSIGADGFSYVTPQPGSVESARSSGGKVEAQNTEIFKINSVGTVVLEDNVEVGACATIDRANVGATLIRRGTKVDNLVMIGHNNEVGENCLIVSQAGISGSCKIGDRVVIAGQAGLADHLKIGDDAIVMAKSGVMRDIQPKEVVVGIPALPRRETLMNVAYTARLREMFQEIKYLKQRLDELEAMAASEKETAGV